MKFTQQNFRLIIIGIFVSMIFAFGYCRSHQVPLVVALLSATAILVRKCRGCPKLFFMHQRTRQ